LVVSGIATAWRRREVRLLLAVALGAGVALVGVHAGGGGLEAGQPVAAPTDRTRTAESAAPSTRAPDKPPEDPCAAVIQGLPPRQRLAQLLMVGVDPSSAASATRVAKAGVGGIFLGGSDTTLLEGGRSAAIRDAAIVPVDIAVDEEGGRVQRVDALDGDMPSARTMATTMTVDQVRGLARARADALRSRGVTVDFAPVLDVTTQGDGEVIGDRSFGSDPEVVSRYAGAFADGLAEGGVLPVVKHFPGHGRASGDSHLSLVNTPPLDELRAVDFVPYRTLLGSVRTAVMVGHLSVPDVTDGLPATLSPAAYRLLRDELTFDDVVFTDDLGGMRAVAGRYPLPQAVLTALSAGADVALWSSGEQHLDTVLDTLEGALASGQLPPQRVTESLTRVLRAKNAC
jgi:beta-N-acetylhexosaminidase